MTDDKRREAVERELPWLNHKDADNTALLYRVYDAAAAHADSGEAKELRRVLMRTEDLLQAERQALAEVRARCEDPCEHPDEVPEDVLAILAKLERGSDA